MHIVRLSAEEVAQAMNGQRTFRRLSALPRPLCNYDLRTLFVDPPRELAVSPGRPAVIPPQDTHYVVLEGPVRMQVDFFHEPPMGNDDG